jgi:pimeloyl-ACP methyl ester carboxylesterase
VKSVFLRRLPYSLPLLICLAFTSGCDSYLAGKFVEAPNHHWSVRGKDAPPDVLADHHVAQQLRIDVGPPSASLSVWIIDPFTFHGTVAIVPDEHGYPTVRLETSPPTDPPPDSKSQISNFKSQIPKATIFLLAGLGDGKDELPYQFYSLALAAEGYRVIMVDHRGHGRSTGDRIGYGSYESHDMVQVLDTLQERGLIGGEVGIVGISYGASVGICWAAIDPRVRVVIALEPFSSIRDAEADAGPMMLGIFKNMFSKKDYDQIIVEMGQIDGFDPDRQSPLFAIAHTTTPVLLIAGKADDFVRPAHSQRLHAAAPDHTKLILVDGAGHFTLWYLAAGLIMHETNDWFDRYLAPTPPSAALVPLHRYSGGG